MMDRLVQLHVDRLEADPHNPRSHGDGADDDLVASVRSVGVLEPLLVRAADTDDEHWWVAAGTRRLDAARRAGLDHIACVVRDDLDDDAVVIAALVENAQRRDLDPIAQGRALQRLYDRGLTQEQIAEQVGKSGCWVSQRLSLLKLDADAQARVAAREIGVERALKQARRRPKGAPRGRHVVDDRAAHEWWQAAGAGWTPDPSDAAPAGHVLVPVPRRVAARLADRDDFDPASLAGDCDLDDVAIPAPLRRQVTAAADRKNMSTARWLRATVETALHGPCALDGTTLTDQQWTQLRRLARRAELPLTLFVDRLLAAAGRQVTSRTAA